MSLTDLPIPIMFLFFLLLFLLVGLYPAWKRTAVKFKGLLKKHEKEGGLSAGDFDTEMAVEQLPFAPLDDFEIMVLRCIAQNAGNGFTRKQIDAELFLGKSTVNKSLQTLMRRGLVYLAISPLFLLKFHLSDQGRVYAIEHEYIPRVHAGDVLF